MIYSFQGPLHAFAALEGEGFLRRLFDQSLPVFAFLHTINAAAREMVAVIRVDTGIKEGAIRRGSDGCGFQDKSRWSGHVVVQYVLITHA